MSPEDPDVLNSYGQFKRHTGEYLEAIRLGRLALQADPETSGRYYQLGISHRYSKNFGASASNLRRAIALNPTAGNAHAQLAFTEISRGNHSVALREFQAAEHLFGEDAPDWRIAQLAFGYSQLGRRGDVLRLYERLEGMDAVGHASWAMADVARGAYGEALGHLEAAVDSSGAGGGSPLLGELRANVYSDPALEGPQFKSLLDGVAASD